MNHNQYTHVIAENLRGYSVTRVFILEHVAFKTYSTVYFQVLL